MERRFVIPASITLALHAIVLFGFRNPEARGHEKERFVPVPLCNFHVPPFEEEVRPIADAPGGGGSEAKSLPRAPEIPPITPGDGPVIDLPRHPPSIPGPDIPVIDPKPFGPGPGIGSFNGPGGPLDSRFLDNSPRARLQIPPVFPPEERRTGTSGEAHVEFLVDESGAVTAPRVVKATSAAFGAAALRAVAKWRFEPGRKDGRVVPFRMVVPIVFSLDS